jgi:hypothetical protein
MNMTLNRIGRWTALLCIILGITGLLAYAASKFTSGKLVVIITAVGILGFAITLTVLAFRLKKFWRIVKTIVLSLLAVIVGTYMILFAFVYFFQDALANKTSSFFQPKTISAEAAQALATADVTDIDLATADGAQLRGWLVWNSTEE